MFSSTKIAKGYSAERLNLSGLMLFEVEHQERVKSLITKIKPRLRSVDRPFFFVVEVTDCVRLVKVTQGKSVDYDIVGLACFKETILGPLKGEIRYYGCSVIDGVSLALQRELEIFTLNSLKDETHYRIINLSQLNREDLRAS